MTSRRNKAGLIAVAVVVGAVRVACTAAEPLNVGRDKQFFVDDHVVESQQNVTRELHQPVRDERNPVLVGDQPWEGWILEAHGRPVVFDPLTKQWMFYYVTWVPDNKFAYHQRYLTCVATSEDGIVWKKPRLGQFEWDGSRDNNILNVGQQNWMRRANVILDEHETDPRQRFKMTFVDVIEDKKTAIIRAGSADGLTWHRLGEPWVNSGFGHNLNVLGWDARNEEYVLFPRYVVDRSRVGVGRSTSKDFITWTNPKPVIIPELDEKNLEFKGMGAFTYDGAYFGSLWVFFNGVEKAESELAFSRDGINWTRPFRGQVFFPRGQPGQWDSAMILAPAPVVRDDQIWFYYTGWNFPYGPGPLTKVRKGWFENGQRQLRAVGLAKLRLDGFVSMTAGNDEGVVTTKPFEIVGDHLHVNVAAPQGQVSVEVLDFDGKPLPGFSGTSAPVQNKLDDVRWQPRWKAHADLSTLRGKVVRLRFHLRNSRLYAFQVR